MKKKFIIIFLFAVVFVIYKYGFSRSNNPTGPKSVKVADKIFVEQKLQNDESFNKYEVEVNKTALDLLKQSTDVVTKGEKENAYVTEISGRTAEETKKEFWSFYINGKMSAVGAGSYLLKNGDKIEWKIENY